MTIQYYHAYNCTKRDYLATLDDETLRDLYAIAHGYSICQGEPYRYQARIDGRLYILTTLPTREEMIQELIYD